MEDKIENSSKEKCYVHVMPPAITDEDISSLLNGIIGVMRKKFELETQAEMISMNVNISKLEKQLKDKTAECNRLKNEILYLKQQLN